MNGKKENRQDRLSLRICIDQEAAQAAMDNQHGKTEQEERKTTAPQSRRDDSSRLKAVPPEACRPHCVI